MARERDPSPIDEEELRLALAAVEEYLGGFENFVHRARQAATRALFFLRLLYPTGRPRVDEAIARYRPFALSAVDQATITFAPQEPSFEQLDILLTTVDPEWRVRRENWLAEPADFPAWLLSVRSAARRDDRALDPAWQFTLRLLTAYRRCGQILEVWQDTGRAPAPEPPEARARRFARFLSLTAGGSVTKVRRPFHRLITDYLGCLHKHLALLMASLLVAIVLLGVEAVRSLIFNSSARAALVSALVLLPMTATQFLIWRRRSRKGPRRVHFWDIGGPGHRSFHAPSMEPPREVQRYPLEATPLHLVDPGLKGAARSLHQPLRNLWSRLWRPKSIVDAMVAGQLLKLVVYVAGWLLGFGLLFGAVQLDWLDSSTVTLFLILSLLYAALVAGRTVDLWEFLDPRPIRVRLLLTGVAGLVALLLDWGHDFFILAFTAAAAWLWWTYHQQRWRRLQLPLALLCLLVALGIVWQKLTHEQGVWREPPASQADGWRIAAKQWPFPGNQPVVVVASSGGGSRAAIYTALTLASLETGHPDCGRPRAASAACRSCEVGAQIHAISSVSGGSLASAGYIVRKLAPTPGGETPLVRAVGRDFLLPTLLGALVPGRSRGDAIERRWQGLDELARPAGAARPQPRRGGRGVALGDYRLSHLAAAWQLAGFGPAGAAAPDRPPFPLPIFNTSTLDGHDVVLTPLPASTYSRRETRAWAKEPERSPYSRPGSTWVFHRDAIYGLEDLLGEQFDPLLSSAVRASANFPFGFPLVRIETGRKPFLSPRLADAADEETVHLTDGGALSNSGMWPLYRLLINKADSLADRGVLLILVDASRMPTLGRIERTVLGLRATIGDQAPIGQYLHRTMLAHLRQLYGNNFAAVQIDLTPHVDRNVLTTWALDTDSRRLLRDTFSEQWCQEQAGLLQRWKFLKRDRKLREADDGADLIDQVRPPID